MLSARELKALLRQHRLGLSKRLGQHHLVESRAIARVVAACALTRDETVVEIGAGLGALTEPLAQAAGAVLAVEVDRKISALLAERVRHLPRVTVLQQDILSLRDDDVRGVVVVGALPYQLTSPILVWLAERRTLVRRAILVVQAEVADRLVAKPATKAYGRLSILAQYAWRVERVAALSRTVFFPPPQVDSVCIRLTPHAAPPVDVADEAGFFAVVKAAFGHRRKTLANCLRVLREPPLDRAAVDALLQHAGVPPAVRGETLTLAQFATLANGWSALSR